MQLDCFHGIFLVSPYLDQVSVSWIFPCRLQLFCTYTRLVYPLGGIALANRDAFIDLLFQNLPLGQACRGPSEILDRFQPVKNRQPDQTMPTVLVFCRICDVSDYCPETAGRIRAVVRGKIYLYDLLRIQHAEVDRVQRN